MWSSISGTFFAASSSTMRFFDGSDIDAIIRSCGGGNGLVGAATA